MSSSQTAVGAVGAVSAAVGGSSAAVPAMSMTTVGNIHRISSFWGNFAPGTITRDPRVQNVFFFCFFFMCCQITQQGRHPGGQMVEKQLYWGRYSRNYKRAYTLDISKGA